MPSLAGLLIGGVLPGVIALSLLAVSQIRNHHLSRFLAVAIPPLAITLAFAPAPISINGKPDIWPVNASERALAIAIAASSLGLLAELLRKSRWIRPLSAFLAGAFAAFAVLGALHPHAVSTPALVIGLVIAGTWVAATAHMLARVESLRQGPGLLGMLAIWFFAASLVMLFSAIGVFAQQLGSLVPIVSAAAIVAFWTRRPVLGPGAFVPILSILTYFLIGTWQFSTNPPVEALGIIAAIPLVLAGLVRGGSRRHLILTWGMLSAASIVAVAWAFTIYRGTQNSAPADW